jgi:anti-sigma regulatory factor (Ser/Thr protein kinase)
VALIFESHAEGWQELVRELKCNPRTNWVPMVGIFPSEGRDEPVTRLTVLPDELVYEPFDFADFIRTAGSGLAERVTAGHHELTELEIHLPGTRADRKEARDIVEEVLFRSSLPEEFCRQAGAALHEALENAHRHGHQLVDCCTIQMRMILDPKRLVIAVRDSGKGFDHVAALAAARGDLNGKAKDPLAKAAAALRTSGARPQEPGGISRMLELVDRVDYNRQGNEIVLTKLRR